MTGADLATTSDDVTLGVRLLAGVPTNEDRAPAVLHAVSSRAQRFGRELAATTATDRAAATGGHRVVERDDGLARPVPLLARYRHRDATIELFTDALAHVESLIDRRGWRALFPAGSVRAAAVAHETAHHLIAGPYARDLRVAVAVPALRIGPWTRWAHVAGAEELAAHAFAQARLGLTRSPLLLTAAAADDDPRPDATRTGGAPAHPEES